MANASVTMLPLLGMTDPWQEVFFGLDPELRFALICVLVGIFTAITMSIAGMIYYAFDRAHRRKLEADLKREMLDRGMSADDIVKVMEAAAPLEDATSRWINSWCKSRGK